MKTHSMAAVALRIVSRWLLPSAVLLTSCAGDPAAEEEEPRGPTGSLKLATSIEQSADVEAIRFTLQQVDCDTAEPIGDPIVEERPIEDITIPGDIAELENQPLDEDSAHLFADLFQTLEPGCYDVIAAPIQGDGELSQSCDIAFKLGVEVTEGEVTEIFLLNQCHGVDPGSLDVIATLNHEPEIDDVSFEESKFVLTCGDQVVCATASDPDGDPLEFVWEQVGGPELGGFTVESHTENPDGSVTECIRFVAHAAGGFEIRLTVYDLLHASDGSLQRIEDWLTIAGYPNPSHAQFTFPFYADTDALPVSLVSTTLIVPAEANVFGAGHTFTPGGGGLPPSVSFPVSPDAVVTFPSVTGMVSCCGPSLLNDADGNGFASGNTNILSASGVSGLIHDGKTMFLVGVFVNDDEPVDPAPPRVDYTDAEDTLAFTPLLNQTFFIGDGFADVAGAAQSFVAPPGATRLFLGFADAVEFGNPIDPPGFYFDNFGELEVALEVSSCTPECEDCIWPNQESMVNGDEWLREHHDDVARLEPKLLALVYANPGSFASQVALVDQVVAGFAEGSRTQGFDDPGAAVQLQYQVNAVDLRDGVEGRPPPPPGYPYENSTLWPRRPMPDIWGFDYAALFTEEYAPYLGYEDPDSPGDYLDLCTLVQQGLVNEVWVVGSQDVPDVSIAEVVGVMPIYDADGNPTGSINTCAGNGCMNTDVPYCGHSLRIGFVNYTRGPGCFLHSQGHAIEFGVQTSVPDFGDWFRPFARFDLDTTYGLPFPHYYALGCSSPPCIQFLTPSHAEFTLGTIPYDVDPYDPVCGNVHFAPNGVSHYDYSNPQQVLSSCTGFGRHAGPGGTDATELIDPSAWSMYFPFGDCGGEFLVWWYQNMPGHESGQTFADATPMKSAWPFLFY